MKPLLLIALRLKIAILRWWYIRRASAMLHARIRWELRAERDLSRSDSESASIAYRIAEKYRIRDFAYQLRLKQICPEVQIGVPPWWSAHEDAWKSGALPLLLILCLSLCACETTVKSRNGTTLLRHASDSARLRYTYSGGGENVTLEIDDHRPSTTIRAGGSIVGTAGSALTGVAASVLLR